MTEGVRQQAVVAGGVLAEKRRRQALDWMWTLIEDGLKARFRADPAVVAALPALAAEVEVGRAAPTAAANALLQLFRGA